VQLRGRALALLQLRLREPQSRRLQRWVVQLPHLKPQQLLRAHGLQRVCGLGWLSGSRRVGVVGVAVMDSTPAVCITQSGMEPVRALTCTRLGFVCPLRCVLDPHSWTCGIVQVPHANCVYRDPQLAHLPGPWLSPTHLHLRRFLARVHLAQHALQPLRLRRQGSLALCCRGGVRQQARGRSLRWKRDFNRVLMRAPYDGLRQTPD
jgi:hypothetical protein